MDLVLKTVPYKPMKWSSCSSPRPGSSKGTFLVSVTKSSDSDSECGVLGVRVRGLGFNPEGPDGPGRECQSPGKNNKSPRTKSGLEPGVSA